MSGPSSEDTVDWLLRSFATFWIWIVIAINLAALVGVYIMEQIVWAAIAAAQDWFGPHNLINFLYELLLLSPALLAFWILDRRARRRGAKE
jgi:hypothetical protein